MSIRLHLCVYRATRDELSDRFYRRFHSSIEDFDPNDEELHSNLREMSDGGDREAQELLSDLHTKDAYESDLMQFILRSDSINHESS